MSLSLHPTGLFALPTKLLACEMREHVRMWGLRSPSFSSTHIKSVWGLKTLHKHGPQWQALMPYGFRGNLFMDFFLEPLCLQTHDGDLPFPPLPNGTILALMTLGAWLVLLKGVVVMCNGVNWFCWRDKVLGTAHAFPSGSLRVLIMQSHMVLWVRLACW